MGTSALAFALLALVTTASLSAAQDETERVSRTVTLNPGGTLHLKSFSGHVRVTAADRSDVEINAVRRAPKVRLDHIKLDIRGSGDDIYIDANKRDSIWWRHNNVVDTDFDIQVPHRTSLDIGVFSADVAVHGVEGTHRVNGFSSRLRLEDIVGSVKAHTFSGPVEVHAREWRDGQDIDIDTFSGNVTLRVPDAARGTVSFSSFSGHLKSQLPLTFRDGGRRSLRATLGNAPGGGTLRFKTFSGSVQIDR
jgi:DUF4097 and DUF4098 domain-containing protein YvlB